MPTNSELGADTLGDNLYDGLGDASLLTFKVPSLDGVDFVLPATAGNVLYNDVEPIALSDLTSGTIGGDGSFDTIMASLKAHLKGEYDSGRITGSEYTKAYVELTTAALQTGLQFVMSKDQTYWASLLAQAQARRAETDAVTSRVQFESAKVAYGMGFYQYLTSRGQLAMAKMQLANEDMKYTLGDLQTDLIGEQINLVKEQVEAKRGETLDTRTDGVTAIVGMIGKQKALYDQQIDSYQKDSTYKVGKLFTDAWITQKTLDEGLVAPANFVNAEVDEVLSALRTGVGLGTL